MTANLDLSLSDELLQAIPYNVGSKTIMKTTRIMDYIAKKPIFK